MQDIESLDVLMIEVKGRERPNSRGEPRAGRLRSVWTDQIEKTGLAWLLVRPTPP